MTAVAVVVGALVIAATVLTTAARYRELPERIPIHFAIDGTADNYGPRYMVWLLVGVQIATAVSYLLIFGNGRPRGMLVVGDALLAICLIVQLRIISAATSGKNRVNTLGFWILFAALLGIGVAATRFNP
jgi:hypothetical protein